MAKQAVRLEVFPVQTLTLGYADGSEGKEEEHEVRLVAGNGRNLLHSRQGYSTRSNAIRAAREVNQITATEEYPNGRLRIRVLNQAGHVDRTINPKRSPWGGDE